MLNLSCVNKSEFNSSIADHINTSTQLRMNCSFEGKVTGEYGNDDCTVMLLCNAVTLNDDINDEDDLDNDDDDASVYVKSVPANKRMTSIVWMTVMTKMTVWKLLLHREIATCLCGEIIRQLFFRIFNII